MSELGDIDHVLKSKYCNECIHMLIDNIIGSRPNKDNR